MLYPQTYAERIAGNIRSIADFSCCALTFIWCMNLDPDNAEALKIVSDAIDAGVLKKDCTVKWEEFGKWLTGRKVEVNYRNIQSLEDIKNLRGRIPVRYDHNGKSHWVGVEDGEIRFNSLVTSVCVNKGKPVTARIITMR